jgi:two-component system sensor histidine kinase QseC
MSHSIRRRLLVTTLSAILVVWMATAFKTYLDTRSEINTLMDAQLAQSARVLMTVVSHELQEEFYSHGREHVFALEELRSHLGIERYEHQVAFQVWVGDDHEAIRSSGAPLSPMSTVSYGFSDENIAGRGWRVITLTDPDGLIRLHVGEQIEVREQLTSGLALQLLTPLLVGLPLLALLIWFGVGKSLRPLNRLAADVAEREPLRLEPVVDNPVPAEVKPLVTALNDLFERLRRAFEKEHRFTADAAHELRTPLAGLRTQAEVARRATDNTQRTRALDKMINGVDRTTHLVSQLLTMARLDPEVGLQASVPVDLSKVTSMVVAELAEGALAKDIELDLQDHCQGQVRGNPDVLASLVRNLVDNAIRYTAPCGHVSVTLTSSADKVTLVVEDSGPGIPENEREKVFERFYRGTEPTASGSGLGMSIVRRIADLHNATITLDRSRYQGLAVSVTFPVEAVPR